jgi:hypothetical protein
LDVLGNDDSRSNLGNKSAHFRPEVEGAATASRRCAEGLAREPATDGVNGNSICGKALCGERADIVILGNLGPVFRQDAAAVGIDLAEGDGAKPATALEAEGKPADARK